ncbi:unnamed protein product [Cylicocyclus nassatus]|uniref:Uncharacterized protein n=1 Tax=Cylicocyclus nassatus TaxID=53992 RepID=A0AA36MAX7_CYLNA|nr:unnamed protein product [Cylicocyclus nassatus]
MPSSSSKSDDPLFVTGNFGIEKIGNLRARVTNTFLEFSYSQLSLMIIHAIIITYLFLSNMFHIYNIKSPENETSNVTISPKEDLDVNALKVAVAIIAHILSILTIFASLLENNLRIISKRLPPLVVAITLVFALVFNAVASICMWFHDAPHLPGGYSRTIRGCAVLSSAGCLFTLINSVVFCTYPPARVTYKTTAVKDINVLKESKDSKSDDRDKMKRETPAAKSSSKLKEVQSPALPAATSPEPPPPPPQTNFLLFHHRLRLR